MAYIAPDSTIRFHKNIVLDDTYDHTYYFDSITAQDTFFSDSTKVMFQLDNYSYQRHTSNSIRIARKAEDVMNCSYISFKNSAFENKWFYAFLTNYEYVNNSTTIIYYEIDVMQTFMFDIEWKQCYIERQHTVTDNIGDNTIPENLELGEYLYDDLGILGNNYNTSYKIVIAATFMGEILPGESDYTFYTSGGNWYNGVYSGVFLNDFGDSIALANKFIVDATSQNKSDGIVAIYMIPLGLSLGAGETNAGSQSITIPKNVTWNIGNVAVKNNKLYTYPYNFLYVTNNQGNSAEYRWEFFPSILSPQNQLAYFTLKYYLGPSPEMAIIPENYNLTGTSTTLDPNYNEMLTIDNFPMCAFNIDAYKAWLAQNATKLNISGISSIVNGVVQAGAGVLTGNAYGAVTGVLSAAENVANILGEVHVAKTMPPFAKGQSANVLNTALKNFGFRGYYVRVRDEYARIIDDYFTRYGYAIHQNAVPNLCARTRFTYVKTVDCTIEAEIANEYTQKIVSIMNNGITFWNDKTSIGNYESPNTIISG
jgi:hypothetical protein